MTDSTARTRGRSPLDPVLLLAVTLAVFGALLLLMALSSVVSTPNWSDDFVAYRSASVRLANGGSLYLAVSLQGAFEPIAQNLYLYPPPLAIAITPITALSETDGALAWYFLHIAVLAASCALMPVRWRTRILVFGVGCLSFGVLRDLILGNVSVMLLLPLAAAWRWLDRPLGSLALALATSVRVTLGIFVLWLLVRQAWRPLLWLVAGGAAIALLSLLAVGIEEHLDYLTVLANVRDTGGLVQNRHLTYLALRLGAPVDMTWLVLPPVWVLAMVAVVVSRRRDPEVGFMVTAGASLLLAPLIWDHYLSILLLPAAFLFERGRRWALALPLCTWLPAELLPLVAIAALLLPFLARERDTHMDTQGGVHARARLTGVGSDMAARSQ